MSKKVSIVLPVYNTEKFLGYCLNSLLCQTYSNLEIIIVNDGSTDSSLQICRNYAKLDARFRVFTIKNGGVSNARNFGIAKATGDYLTFVDSDDVINCQYIEKLVSAAETHKVDLVVSDLMMVDFYHPENRIVLTGKNFVNKTPLAISKQDFAAKKMEIIWKTSLLEGACGKLLSLKKWRNNNITFNTNLSLGEDFIANLEYYQHANGVVFINEDLYYYNNIDGSDSLSHKYRPDLFQNQMFLAKELGSYLGGVEAMSSKNRVYYYNYVAAYGINCIVSVLKANKYSSQNAKAKALEEIVSDDFFRNALQNAKYLSYPNWKPWIINKNVKKLASVKIQENAIALKGSVINKAARMLLRLYYQKIRNNPTRFKQLDMEIATTGVKNTIKRNLFKK